MKESISERLDDREYDFEPLESCKILKRSKDAVLINFKGRTHWIPYSVIEKPHSLREFADVTVQVKRWFVAKNEI